MKDAGVHGVVIGGVAVALHGHLRTTRDVDLMVDPPLDRMRDLLTRNGFLHDGAKREFVKNDVQVHPVRPEDAGVKERGDACVIDGVTAVDLVDLVAMKLRSGSADPLRAQDLADVIGLARHHGSPASSPGTSRSP